MANPKAAFYTSQLYGALTAGEWASETPSRAGHRAGMSWPELLRKFRKHCAQLHDFAEIVSHTQALSLLLIKTKQVTPDALDADHTNPNEPLTLGEECLILEERREEVQSSYQVLQMLPQSDSLHLVLASCSFGLGKYNDVISHLSSFGREDTASLNASNVGSVSSAFSVPASHESKTTIGSPAGSFTPSVAALDTDITSGKVWKAIEKIRAWCLQGMAYESLVIPSPPSALRSYERALPLLDLINIPKSLPSIPGKPNTESFIRYRELWRWVERLLWRSSILSAKVRSISQTLPLLRAYQAHSIHWPATFRPEHRSTISQLHLRALIESYSVSTKSSWLNEARSIVTDYRVVLTATTKFPRAGQRNAKVEEFVDLCVAIWDVNGANSEQTGWVIDILWWATQFTFNSHRIYRHLTRTLYVSGDADLARRILRLYVQIVSKSRQTVGHLEEDKFWAETLIHGARMLCRIPGGIEEVREAGELLLKARARLDEQDKVIVASLKRAEGVWHTCMALREQEPLTRPKHLSDSVSALRESLALHPTPSTHFHLALALARPGPSRDLAAAISSARAAVEGDPNEIRYWHLLGLLLAATEDWKAARGVLEIGAEIGDRPERDGAEESYGRVVQHKDQANGHATGFGTPREVNSQDSQNVPRLHLLADTAVRLPPAVMLHRPIPDYPSPTLHERFEHALQLRMTQLSLIEHVDGPENAGAKWVEVFGWVAERKGLGEEGRSLSVEPPPSEGNLDASTRQSPLHPATNLTPSRSLSPQGAGVDTSIPINLIPPSPQENATRLEDSISPGNNEKQDYDLLHEKESHERSKGKKVQRILKERVHKGQEHIHTISRKIGRGSGLKRSRSAPDFRTVLSNSKPYQASSIHSRQRLSTAYMRHNSPEPPPPPASPKPQASTIARRSARERRLLSNLWLTSAATFRRMVKIDQAKAAIQEAEFADDENPDVWVQLGLYYATLGHSNQAIQSFHKALFISPEHVPAFVHLTQQYLTATPNPASTTSSFISRDNIDLAAGILSDLTRRAGWDIPEAWYLLARAYGLQGKQERERECLGFALGLIEGRGVRDLQAAVGWCL